MNPIYSVRARKKVPDEWKETVSGIKNAFTLVNYVANIGGFMATLGFPMGTAIGAVSGTLVEGVRIIIIDP